MIGISGKIRRDTPPKQWPVAVAQVLARSIPAFRATIVRVLTNAPAMTPFRVAKTGAVLLNDFAFSDYVRGNGGASWAGSALVWRFARAKILPLDGMVGQWKR